MTENPDSPSFGPDDHIEFHYQKSPQYRSVHCDGFYGGITPRGYINFSLFNERPPIPRHVIRKVISSDSHTFKAGPEEVIDTYHGIMRQIECTVFMDLSTAREFLEWFGSHLKTLENLSKPQKSLRKRKK